MLHYFYSRSPVIRQKDESQNDCFKKTKHAQFPKNKNFLPPDTHTCVSGGKKCLFFGKFDLLSFLKTPILRFALLPQRGLLLSKNRFWEPVTSDYISGCKTFLFGQFFRLALLET